MTKALWSKDALADLRRVIEFLEEENPQAALYILEAVESGTQRLLEHPRIGEQVEEFLPREVRRLMVASYELHYEVGNARITILRLWHQREDRLH